MVRITVYRDAEQRLRRLTATGHAAFSDDEHGGDIVCAAVSALTGYLGIAFSEEVPQMGAVRGDDGYFDLVLAEPYLATSEVAVMLGAWLRAVEQLEENYLGWVKVEQRTWSQETA